MNYWDLEVQEPKYIMTIWHFTGNYLADLFRHSNFLKSLLAVYQLFRAKKNSSRNIKWQTTIITIKQTRCNLLIVRGGGRFCCFWTGLSYLCPNLHIWQTWEWQQSLHLTMHQKTNKSLSHLCLHYTNLLAMVFLRLVSVSEFCSAILQTNHPAADHTNGLGVISKYSG